MKLSKKQSPVHEEQQEPAANGVPQEELESARNAAVKPLEAIQTSLPFESAPAATSKLPVPLKKQSERLIDRSKQYVNTAESQIRLLAH